MPRALVRHLLLAAALAGAFFCGRFAVANAAAAEDVLAGQLTPSATPGLLGPITSAGRKGWDCKPEHAAASASVHAAELPAAPDTR
ncbi:MAG: hypothetical protein JO029_07430 [Candidatus Eremiobacteraeota bacterium]|nr:hypothetical protein [Candidatus Eremiobacteraeota bacterium]